MCYIKRAHNNAATTDGLTESSCCLLGLSHILLTAFQKTAADSVDCRCDLAYSVW